MTGATEPGRGHRSIPHTADTIVEAWAPRREACLEEMVAGLGETFAEVKPSAVPFEVDVEVSGVDVADLVLALLEECLFLLDARGLVACGARLDPAQGESAVTGVLVVVDSSDIEVVGAIPKAVAEPVLYPVPDAAQWRARVIVDV